MVKIFFLSLPIKISLHTMHLYHEIKLCKCIHVVFASLRYTVNNIFLLYFFLQLYRNALSREHFLKREQK